MDNNECNISNVVIRKNKWKFCKKIKPEATIESKAPVPKGFI